MLQLSMGPLDWDIFLWPANIITLFVLVLLSVLLYTIRRHVYFLRFMTTWQAAVPAIAAVVFITVIMGLTRQVSGSSKPADSLGISKMLSFWPFILVYAWMTAIVGQETLLQLTHLFVKSETKGRRLKTQIIPACLSHLGLFIVLTCGTLGSADMQRLKMYCEQGKPEWRGLDGYNNVHELPLAIELQKFSIDEYPPKLMIVDNDGKALPYGKPQILTVDSTFKDGKLLDWTVTILKHNDNAVLVLANRNTPNSKLKTRIRKGWVTCGSYHFPSQELEVDKGLRIVMPQREPKRYFSLVNIYTKDGKNIQTSIEVNHPYSVNGWKIYQYSYNEQMGKWSTLSVFELVRDPWLPVVYFGIFLLALGAIGMIFTNHKTQTSKLKP